MEVVGISKRIVCKNAIYVIPLSLFHIFNLFQEVSMLTNRLTDRQEICSYLEIVYKHPKNVSQKVQDVLFGNSVEIPKECLHKVSERYLIQNKRYTYIGLISVRK